MKCPFCSREIPENESRCETCGFLPLDGAAADAVGIHGYRILGEIGRGGAGVVYLAVQRSLDRQLAVKMLPRENLADQSAIDDFFREAKTVAKLDHPNIVRMIEAGRSEGGNCFFSMELVRGITGEEQLKRSCGRIEFKRLLDIAIAVADALDYGYREFTLTHGDIKPSNLIIRGSDGAVKLADFGLARFGQEKREGDVVATPMYTAPEIVSKGHAGFGVKADMYSFGIMLYEMLCGTAPFTGEPGDILAAHLEKIPPPLTGKMPGCNPDFSGLVAWLLAKNPADRPGSWRSVLNCLKAIRRAASGEKLEQARRKFPLRTVVLAAAETALLLGLAGYAVRRSAHLAETPQQTPVPAAPTAEESVTASEPDSGEWEPESESTESAAPTDVSQTPPAPLPAPVPVPETPTDTMQTPPVPQDSAKPDAGEVAETTSNPTAPQTPSPAQPVFPAARKKPPEAPYPNAPADVPKPAAPLAYPEDFPDFLKLPALGNSHSPGFFFGSAGARSVLAPEYPYLHRTNPWRKYGHALYYPVLTYPAPTLFSEPEDAGEDNEPPPGEDGKKQALDKIRAKSALFALVKQMRGRPDLPLLRKYKKAFGKEREAELSLLERLIPRSGYSAGDAPADEIFRNYLIFNSGDFERSNSQLPLRHVGGKVRISRIDTVGITVAVNPPAGKNYRQVLNWSLFHTAALENFVKNSINARRRSVDDSVKTLFVGALLRERNAIASLIAEKFGKCADGETVVSLGILLRGAERYKLADLALLGAKQTGDEAILKLLGENPELAAALTENAPETLQSLGLRREASASASGLKIPAPNPQEDSRKRMRDFPDEAGYVNFVRYAVKPVPDSQKPLVAASACRTGKEFFAAWRRGFAEAPETGLLPDTAPWRTLDFSKAKQKGTPPSAADLVRGRILRRSGSAVPNAGNGYREVLRLRGTADLELSLGYCLWQLDGFSPFPALAAIGRRAPDESHPVLSLLVLRALLFQTSAAKEEEIDALTALLARSKNPADAALARCAANLFHDRPVAADDLRGLYRSSAPEQWTIVLLNLECRNRLLKRSGFSRETLELLRPPRESSSLLSEAARAFAMRRLAGAATPRDLAKIASADLNDPSYAMSGAYAELILGEAAAYALCENADAEQILIRVTPLLTPYGFSGRFTMVALTSILRTRHDRIPPVVPLRSVNSDAKLLVNAILLGAIAEKKYPAAVTQLNQLPLTPVELFYAAKILSFAAPPAASGENARQ